MTETKKNPIGRFIENTLVPISTAFAQNRYVRCIGTGSQNLMAIIMIGAVFNLLNSIQIDPYQSFIQATGIAAFLNAVYNACMNFMGVFMVFSVGYAGAKIFDHDELAFNNGLMSLMSYLIMVPVATNEVGSTVVVLDYLGSHGVFLAFILGIMATKINIALVERNITIKMPAGVPENVTQCFTSIIPGAAIALVSSLLRGLFTLTPWGNVIDAVYALLQTPLANITGSLGGFIILLLLAQILGGPGRFQPKILHDSSSSRCRRSRTMAQTVSTRNSAPLAGDRASQVNRPSSTKPPLRRVMMMLGICSTTTAPNSHR